MLSAFVSRMVILLFGTLYPAYASYKAVRTKNVKEYVKWMMYWIVYAFFTCIETFTDIFLSWFPFYYEVKVILVIWLLSPATKGSSTLYRKFVHPMLTRREHEIDEYLNQAKEKGYTTVLQLGSKGMNYATSVIMQTAIKGGGNLVQTLKKSYSLSDLSEPDTQRTQDEIDEITRPQRTQRVLRPRTQSTRSASGGRNMPEMYFPEVDVTQASRTARDAAPNYNYIRSSEDISSGYSSAEPVPVALSRTASLSHATRGATRLRSKRSEAGGNSWEDDGEGDYPFSPSSPPQSPFSNDSSLSSFYAPQDRFRYSFDGEPLYLVEEEDDSAKIVEITEALPESSEDFRPIKQEIDAEMEEKYRMFQQWLKSQQNSVKNPSNLSEDFRDTRSESSEDEFHELDGDTNQIIVQIEEVAKQETIEAEIPVVVAGVTEEPISDESLTSKEEVQEVSKEEIPESVKESVIASSFPTPPLPGKKSPSHGKGRAPNPPANLPISPPLSADEEDPIKISDKKPSSKKSKLIDYIPGILRPDSAAKPSKSTDNAPKETSI